MKHLMADIAELHEAFDHPVRLDGHVCNDFMNAESSVALQERLMMRLRLVAEEFFELLEGAVGVGGSNGENIDDAKYCISRVLEKWGPGDDYNAIETADALTDLMVVIVGMALELGIPLDRTWAEVHRSNMAKAQPTWWCEKCDCHTEDHDKACVYCGNKVYVQKMVVKKRVDGKVLKPEGWTKPDIEGALKSEVTAERLKESAVLDVPPEGSLERVAEVLGILPEVARNVSIEAKKAMLRKAIVAEAMRVTRMVDDGHAADDIEAHRKYIRLLCRELYETPSISVDDGTGT
jgi:predicted HAD superfamily Cof-like phosphohydrolase